MSLIKPLEVFFKKKRYPNGHGIVAHCNSNGPTG